MHELFSLIEKHENWRVKSCINLIPSENITSPAVRSLLSCDLGHRYTAKDRFYMGTRFIDKVERMGEDLAKQVFGAETACLRPLSGHIADLTVFGLFAKPHDIVMCVSASDFGYPGIWKNGIAKFLQLEVTAFPFQKSTMNIDVERARELVQSKKPRLVMFGASLILFPHPVRELAKVAHDVDAYVCYDGSHDLGLIAGNSFQSPLREGAVMMLGSTHKSFFGPQGGIILADREHGEKIRQRIHPAFVDNAHWNRIAALTMALAEAKQFGRSYAAQVVRNAQALAKALADFSFPVACPQLGFTRSHQVFLDYGGYRNGRKIVRKLESANIIADCGVRLGVCELTRRGMKQNEMQAVAEFIKQVVKDGEDPQKVRKEVEKFMAGFQDVKYCFESG